MIFSKKIIAGGNRFNNQYNFTPVYAQCDYNYKNSKPIIFEGKGNLMFPEHDDKKDRN